MLAIDLITDFIPPLKTSDSVEKALSWMAEFRVNHLPIVNNTELLGLISDEDIVELNEPDQPIGNQRLSLVRPYVNEGQHIYDVIKLVAGQKLTVVPVLDAKNNYLGLISMHDLVARFADMASLANPGGIIVLELGIRDYSLSEVARIVESNQASILSSYITSKMDSTKIDLTLKINKTDLTYIIASFQRYNYTVKASYHQENFKDDTMDRYDSLMNYLNI